MDLFMALEMIAATWIAMSLAVIMNRFTHAGLVTPQASCTDPAEPEEGPPVGALDDGTGNSAVPLSLISAWGELCAVAKRIPNGPSVHDFSCADEGVVMHDEVTDEAIVSSVCEVADPYEQRPEHPEKTTSPQDVLNAFNTICMFLASTTTTAAVERHEISACRRSARVSVLLQAGMQVCEFSATEGLRKDAKITLWRNLKLPQETPPESPRGDGRGAVVVVTSTHSDVPRSFGGSNSAAPTNSEMRFSCRSIRIGSYKAAPGEHWVTVSNRGISFTIQTPREGQELTLRLLESDVIQVLGNLSRNMAVLFVTTSRDYAAAVRTKLGMNRKQGAYYDPTSTDLQLPCSKILQRNVRYKSRK
ncbi:hypothetical protein HPB51_012555 [Rhipicephalus microplus]|uniref:Uncharacterized protein n=1 Tax=Rhipicephalus microplus TaxID=6941 RepID=A0A9J6DGW4_RHIMP|nr:hypothetical protein HPB51_012555 [Rhipicephalus microplus]